jgi:hypothetical protein
MNFIFTDKTALQVVRFRHFMAECQAAHRFLEESYQDILANFDTQVVKFRKKRKIIMADGVADEWL